MNAEKKTDEVSVGSENEVQGPDVSPSRREAISKIGKYAAYVAPAMLALVSTRSAALSR